MRKSLLLTAVCLLCVADLFFTIYGRPTCSGHKFSRHDGIVPTRQWPTAPNAAVGKVKQPVVIKEHDNSPLVRTPTLTNPGGFSPDQYTPSKPPLNPSEIWQPQGAPRPETEFEQMVADSVGRPLPLFGQSLFAQAPSTFSPVDWMQVPSDYIIGPGDELQIRIWGQVQANLRVVVDRSGQIYIPQVGQISVAGIHYGDLEQHLKNEISKIFKNFNVTANIGRLRSIQVFVVGYARYPGTYTISSLSTLVNAIFASGGPSLQGSLRHIQVTARRRHHHGFRFL